MNVPSQLPEAPAVVDLAAIADALDRAGLLVERRGALPAPAAGVTEDSRAVVPGALFIAVRGSVRDGHDYLADAAARGAAAALVEDPTRTDLPALVVRDGRRATALAAAAAYGEPARQLALVGVTGTNGKTTTVDMLRHLLDTPQRPAASIGTLGVRLGSEGAPFPGGSGLTTPGPVELQRLFRRLADAGTRQVAMEVSSHSLDQRRVEGVLFDVAVFTNLTRDHLDYHGTMEAYLAAKARLVEHLTPQGAAVVNADDPSWVGLPATPRVVTFSASGADADVTVRDLAFGPRGVRATLRIAGDEAPLTLPLIGAFNVANACAAAAAAHALGMPIDRIVTRLASQPQVPGRLEVLHEGPTVLRDYAHTPDALERAIAAVRPFATGRLIVLFGAGGDRDRGKRPEMGRIAARDADLAIVTSDNPRTEDPERILDDIEAGMGAGERLRVTDRRDAIARAIALAGPDDVVLLAGKGHETYQIRGTETLPFDEREIVHELTANGRPA
ncbi:UDP-N-acetylmuramoyl-L-alanyl-D-glutamate--2,6-diaminopimelate ligase [Roseisolibacter sp. H3M3-2]|uniref:UDP-N-acetylmuramoyl-L-alanyl-D-glutamate--2, 6-diaminopimelate ligase n=1 Tax=Roseisolibacter sp. H3M3-2 TaxID=3031323 RepID=UPI0023DB5A33|nr:UDP-N-acetylmuramoyl-L-alanyl-D-glutamate--2,6-diaminopimelate ligase [Roseisolibacter sp. H3M3-2]MDF1504213.1 UDP-N-acetylmuramoyl-L-alanyl-D-glutamate--2,6-diaminopimelate ligase [Roseisolibacter sp. H3M3-2]